MDTATKPPGLAAIEDLFGSDHVWVSPWVANLPESYIREFTRLIVDWYPRAHDLSTEWGRYNVQGQVFTRLSQSHDNFVPWAEEKVSFAGQRVLEIGGGSGSCTAALLLAGASVRILEIDRAATKYSRIRCELLETPAPPEFHEIEPDWLNSDAAFDWAGLKGDFAPTMIVCYALIEHLMPMERLALLRNAMRILPSGGHLLIFETPNRLAPIDWHTSKLLFAETLPDWLYRRYLALSPNPHVTSLARVELRDGADDDEALYRMGRGVSFHEFQLAVGLESFEVVQDGYGGKIKNSPNRRVVEDYEAALRRILAEHGIAPGFARPSLDLVLRKL